MSSTAAESLHSPIVSAGEAARPSPILGNQERESALWWGAKSPVSSASPVGAASPTSDVCLPVIDLARWHDAEYRTSLVRDTDRTAREMGFFYVAHPQAVSSFRWSNVNATFDQMRKVFEEHTEAERISLTGLLDLDTLQGYQKLGLQTGSLSKRAPSIKECLALGRALGCTQCDRTSDANIEACPHSVYPSALRQFPSIVNQLRRSMHEVANVLLDLFSLSLGLPINHLRDLHANPRSPLRMHHYPPLPVDPNADPNERAIAAAEHTDYGTITLLLMARNDPGGLQVWLRDSASWLDIPYRDDCIVVNIGDLLMRWTNDRYISNIHRVLMPEAALASAAHRYSIAYFVTPAASTLVKPVTEGDDEAKYAVITAGEYGDAKRKANIRLDEKKDESEKKQ